MKPDDGAGALEQLIDRGREGEGWVATTWRPCKLGAIGLEGFQVAIHIEHLPGHTARLARR